MSHNRRVTTINDFKATTLSGEEQSLDTYAGQVVVVVNTASACGFTQQLGGLEKLYETYGDQGFTVLGFPCNQFGGQEPLEGDDIGAFCQKNYGVDFPMFDKVDVNGDDAHPLFEWLKDEAGGLLNDGIKWNFTKFLVGRDGKVIKRFGSTKSPEAMAGAIEQALAAEA